MSKKYVFFLIDLFVECNVEMYVYMYQLQIFL